MWTLVYVIILILGKCMSWWFEYIHRTNLVANIKKKKSNKVNILWMDDETSCATIKIFDTYRKKKVKARIIQLMDDEFLINNLNGW